LFSGTPTTEWVLDRSNPVLQVRIEINAPKASEQDA
jgi:hypothetical protein